MDIPVSRTAPGWYPDPWSSSHYRYWTGDLWTADTFPAGPFAAGTTPTVPVPTQTPQPEPQTVTDAPDRPEPPMWSVPIDSSTPTAPPAPMLPPPPPPRRLSGGQITAIAVVVALVVGVIAGALTSHDRAATTSAAPTIPQFFPPATTPGPTTPGSTNAPGPADPSQALLSSLVVRQADVGSSVIVLPLDGGADTSQATLDVCNATFASEAQRTARLQDAAVDAQGSTLLSTEAVLYSHAAGTAQAFTELRDSVAKCPATPVTSPVGEPTVATKFNAAPDKAWPATAGVERLAYDFTTTDSSGQTQHSVAVYLRRGRALLGVYFSQPDSPPTVTGQTTIPGVVSVFAGRLAQLPASVVNA